MDLVRDDVKKLYGHYLAASVGSALVVSIYSFVDTIAVGQSVGPMGTAAIAAINPLFGLMVFLAVLCGIGGAVPMSVARGEGKEEKAQAIFTAAVILMTVIGLVSWVLVYIFHEELMRLFGADDETMPYVLDYAMWLIYFFPTFMSSTFLGAFLRNDGVPDLAMKAVMAGGLLNIFGDWFLCFPMDMGMEGAAIATVSGSVLQTLIMCTHFLSPRCGLRLVRPHDLMKAFSRILKLGFGAGVLDLGTVALAIIINNQIIRYGNVNALAVYGVVGTVGQLCQAVYKGVGQALQPLASSNYGAGRPERIESAYGMAVRTTMIISVIMMLLGELFPIQITKLFIAATPEVLREAPMIYRIYFTAFLFMGMNVLSTYFLQSVMRDRLSMIIAMLRSIVLSGALLLILPVFFGLSGVFAAIPAAELLVMLLALIYNKMALRDIFRSRKAA